MPKNTSDGKEKEWLCFYCTRLPRYKAFFWEVQPQKAYCCNLWFVNLCIKTAIFTFTWSHPTQPWLLRAAGVACFEPVLYNCLCYFHSFPQQHSKLTCERKLWHPRSRPPSWTEPPGISSTYWTCWGAGMDGWVWWRWTMLSQELPHCWWILPGTCVAQGTSSTNHSRQRMRERKRRTWFPHIWFLCYGKPVCWKGSCSGITWRKLSGTWGASSPACQMCWCLWWSVLTPRSSWTRQWERWGECSVCWMGPCNWL